MLIDNSINLLAIKQASLLFDLKLSRGFYFRRLKLFCLLVPSLLQFKPIFPCFNFFFNFLSLTALINDQSKSLGLKT